MGKGSCTATKLPLSNLSLFQFQYFDFNIPIYLTSYSSNSTVAFFTALPVTSYTSTSLDMSKSIVRSIKNVANGYTTAQVKVRNGEFPVNYLTLTAQTNISSYK